ncbi:entry exclusion protein TrbK [Mesorhizobium sp. CC13]|uniref:entry exclusion protein TrbK n=1 Tax=Mesorhizobium sp. CC13 TaxID=3029194 RepID=UPI0032664797
MNRPVIIFGLLAAIAALSATTAVVIINLGETDKRTLTEEQRAAREKFFGSGKELPPIEKGQEMRPRW